MVPVGFKCKSCWCPRHRFPLPLNLFYFSRREHLISQVVHKLILRSPQNTVQRQLQIHAEHFKPQKSCICKEEGALIYTPLFVRRIPRQERKSSTTGWRFYSISVSLSQGGRETVIPELLTPKVLLQILHHNVSWKLTTKPIMLLYLGSLFQNHVKQGSRKVQR